MFRHNLKETDKNSKKSKEELHNSYIIIKKQKQQIESRLDAKDKFDKKDNKSDHRASTVEGQRFGVEFS